MNENCGCCEGTEKLTPIAIANRPGQSVLAYRVGTQASFLETMKARLSNLGIRKAELETPLDNSDEQGQVIYPLQRLTTRSANDPSIAMLDAWATVADVLTFYQERIANEGYLRTATERRSILELARLVGYTLRPGVSASAYLAYTLDAGADTTIPGGSRAQSLPDAGESPQTFEASEDLQARSTWNDLKPRLTRPQLITQDNADIIDMLYFQGTATNLKPNDPLLLVFDMNTGANTSLPGQVLRFVKTVEPQNAENRTKVTLQVLLTADSFQRAVQQTVERYRKLETFCVPSEDKLASEVVDILDNLSKDVQDPPPSGLGTLSKILADYLYGQPGTEQPTLGDKLHEAIQQQDALLVTWLDALVMDFEKILSWVPVGTEAGSGKPGTTVHTDQLEVLAVNPALADNSLNGSRSVVDLPALIAPLTKAVSLQPANSLRLEHNVGLEFASRSDINPQLLTVLNPALSTTLYTALAHADVTAPSALQSAQALRVKTAPFGSNAPLRPIYDKHGIFQNRFEEWPLAGAMSIDVTLTPGDSIGVSVEEASGRDSSSISFDGSSLKIIISQRGVNTWELDMTSLPPLGKPIPLTPINAPVDNAATIQVDLLDEAKEYLTLTFQVGEVMHTMHLDGKQDALNVQIDSDPTWTVPKNPPQPTRQHNTTIEFANGLIHIIDTSIPDPNVLALNGQFDQIIPGSWVAVKRLDKSIIAHVTSVQTVTKTDYGVTATVTQLTLDREWLKPTDQSLADIRGITVYAQGEERELADEPIDPVKEAVCGDTIELDGLYDGLQPGRWLIVAGERTDIFGVTGGGDAELVMLSAVRQDVAQVKTQAMTGESQASGDSQMVSGDGQTMSGDGQVADTEALKANLEGNVKMQPGSNSTNSLPGDKTHTFITLANAMSYSYKRDTVTIYGNVVPATHGETRSEVLGSGDGTKELQQFTMQKSPLTYLPAPTAAGATSTLQVRVNNILWHETDSVVAQGPNDRSYTTQTDNDSKTSVIFGNGQHGVRLPTGVENVTALYRFGLGKAGNVKAQQINLLVSRPLGVKSVVNPRPATGGADREDTDQARRNVPLGVMALDRLVSVQDYADFARTFAGIGKASAVRLSDGHRQLVHLTIAGADDIPIETTSDLYQNLFLALRQLGDPFEPLQVALRQIMLLVIWAHVRLQPDYKWESVEPIIRTALLDFFRFERRELGQSVFLSEVISVIQGITGVAYVDMQILDAVDETKVENTLKGQKGKKGKGLHLRKSIPVRLARIDRKVKGPTNLILPAQLAFLSPDVPETLILRELTDEARN